MFVIIYVIITEEKNGEVGIDGPFYCNYADTKDGADVIAREVANSKSKDVIIPRVIRRQPGESIPEVMKKAKTVWFPKFRNRTISTCEIMKREQDVALCPFQKVDMDAIVNALD